MDVPKCYVIVTFLLSLQYTDAGGSCQENIYLEVGKQGVVSCHFENFDIIGWINGDGDVTNTSPFIYMEGSQIYGRGYESGDYDMHPNGSLIINEVKLSHKFNYTVLFVPSGGANEYFKVPVKVYGGSCQENIYLEVGKQGVVSCHFENCDIIGWIHGTGDVTSTSPFIYKEGSTMYGQGYRNGDYGMHPNGSLIINEVKLENEFNYTVLFVPHPTGANNYFEVPVKVYVSPDLGYPVVNGRTNQVVIHGNTRGFINCSMTGIRPRVHLEWVASPDVISLNSEHIVTDNSDGTYNTYLTSSYKVVNSPTGRVSFICRVAGQIADLFPSVTTVYLLLEQRFPVVNGMANQEHVVLDVNREGELTCSMDKVSQDVFLELVTVFPDSSDEILLDSKNNITVNGDNTVNITLTTRFRVLSASIQHFILKCRVIGQEANKYPETTTVELLVTENFPVVNGLVHQQRVVLNVNREDTLTCTMNRVSPTMVLEWVFTPPVSSDEISIENELSKTDNRDDGTSNITLSSSFRVLSQSIHHVTLECRVVDENDGSQHDVTTVALLFDNNFPVVNGLVHQQHVVLNVNREDKLTCTMNRVSQTMVLVWVFTPPVSPDEISIENELSKTDNRDGTSNTTLSSSFRVLSQSIQHVTLECRVVDENDGSQYDVTTVALLFDNNFPVVNGLVHQQHVVLNVNREDKLTCTMNRVSQTMVLEWVFTPPVSPDEISIENELSKTDNRDDGTSNITLSSSFRVLSQSIHHVTLECRVVDENDGSQHDVTTVALLFDNTTDQECESLLNWQLTLAIVLLVFLVVNVIIFWLIVFWIKLGKDFARKYHWVVTNPRQRKELEEAGAADHQSIQEMQPLNPGHQTDFEEADAADHQSIQEMVPLETPTDSGLSSSANSSTASRELRTRSKKYTKH